jgi:hypothetical protein
VEAELILLSAKIEVTLDAKKINRRNPGSFPTREVYPHARAQITAECGVRARLPNGECVLTRSWLPQEHPDYAVALTIPLSCRGFPVVSPPLDEIVYVDSVGRRAIPPRFIRWKGYLGNLGVTAPEDVWAGAEQCQPGGEVRKRCLKLADALSPTRVEGWPYATDKNPADRAQVYGGAVAITFRGTAYDDCCSEGGGGEPDPVQPEAADEIPETELSPFIVV